MTEIWYFGDSNYHSNSYRRYLALLRLGCSVSLFDPYESISPWTTRISWKTGYKFIQGHIRKWLVSQLSDLPKPSVIWVNSGEIFGRKCLEYLRGFGAPIVLYNNDDPTGFRDGLRFSTLLKNLSFYDLCVVMRQVNELEYRFYGARRITRVWMSYDEFVHSPTVGNRLNLSNISFIGTYRSLENRDHFLHNLLCSGLDIEIWGNGWDRSSKYFQLQDYCYGPALGNTYTKVLQESAISIGFLSSTNRDIHTRRTFEIPASGGLLCAERTCEHQLLFEEGREAVYWSSSHECIEVCEYLIQNPNRRETIRDAGMKKVRELGVGNEDICRQILSLVL
ncbi:CgeB family protein [Acaryochloris marina NIES-2412]|uniref:CgeB family protein n=1 Tax=Acaryochloris marina TaxID=155978 RepID=UPI004059F23A